MLRRVSALLLTLLISTLFQTPGYAASRIEPGARPKLVVLLVIDQFRADTMTRFAPRFGNGGFQKLVKNGAYYPLAEYDVLQCMTGPGHATLLTGALPYQNGIPINYWFDQKTQSKTYCAEDKSTAQVGGAPMKEHSGTSPLNMLGTTVSDEWKNSGYPSRVVSIALKDRAAILMGGHRADYAVWYDSKSFSWVTSKKYAPDGKLPDWVVQMNAELQKEKGQKFTWNAVGKGSGLTDPTTTPNSTYLWGVTPGFPHTFTKGEHAALSSPFGIEISRRLAERAIKDLKLGQEKRTDFLFVSLSTHDYLAHGFGPNSRELEEITIAEDGEIAKLLSTIDKTVGLKNTVVALSADHGGGHASEYLTKHGLPGGRIDESKLDRTLNELLKKKFGSPPKGELWLPFSEDFAYYLNHPALDAKSDTARFEAEEIVRKHLKSLPSAAFVVTSTDAVLKRVPAGEVGRKFLLTYYPGRSGDIIMIPKAGWQGGKDYASHLTGYSYDRYVPLIMTGRSFKPGRYAQSAKIVDLAPTLSFILGVTPPSLSEGRVLSESIR
jgi:predicted AlkP superfamily pyrophosphatase or phosphodiesterase